MSNPKLTYQKANGIVKKFIEENSNNINLLKFKIEKNFKIYLSFEIYLSFDYIGDLILDILQGLAKMDQQSFDVAKTLNKNIKQELDKTKFESELPPDLRIQENLKEFLKKEEKHPHLRRVTTSLLTEK